MAELPSLRAWENHLDLPQLHHTHACWHRIGSYFFPVEDVLPTEGGPPAGSHAHAQPVLPVALEAMTQSSDAQGQRLGEEEKAAAKRL